MRDKFTKKNLCKNFIQLVFIALIPLFTSSCASNSVQERLQYADELAAKNSFKKEIIKTKNFYLQTYAKISSPEREELDIYIEGDGFAWRNRYKASNNPTPKNPLALKMAIAGSSDNILYIARPCQYVDFKLDASCQEKFWTGSRFSQSVIDSTNEVVTEFVKKHKFKKVNLFGFSGAAAVAVLVASERKDVVSIKTVAGNLNHKELMKLHKVNALDDSLDAIDVVEKVKDIAQYHFIGGQDKIVPAEIIISFVKRVNLAGGNAKFKIIDEAGHNYEKWPEILSKVFPTSNVIPAKAGIQK